MTLSEKLCQQQALKRRNESQGISLNGRTVRATPGAVRAQPDPDPQNLKQALERIRTRRKPQPTAPQELQALKMGPLDGTVLTNALGSFVHVDMVLSSDCSRVAARAGVVDRLVSLLTGRAIDLDWRRVAFLDTETTGLAGGTGTYAFLIGIGSWCEQSFRVEQYLMRDYPEERAMLLALEERLAGIQLLVTFNGKSFDVPLLQSRFVMSRMKWPLSGVTHLDLLHPARRLWKLRLSDCSLDNLEREVLGIHRQRDVGGHLIPRLYFDYTRTRRAQDIEGILNHNRQDIETLAELAIHVGSILSAPAEQDWQPEDLFCAGRYFQALGDSQLASACTEIALEAKLKPEVRRDALRALAAARKSQLRYSEAATLWEQVLAESQELHERSCEELAIYYEHKMKNPGKALEFADQVIPGLRSGSARVRWQRRKERLVRKMKRPVKAASTETQEMPGLFRSLHEASVPPALLVVK